MTISATVNNRRNVHDVTVRTNDDPKTVSIPPKAGGFGSSLNGGELLMLALATCYCNDLYREAPKLGITLTEVEVECTGRFGGVGEPGSGFQYRARVVADAPPEKIAELLRHTDRVAEIQNTLRQGLPITLVI
ncbi:OsmC family protein [Larkinella soli]|uniref:OsmC family protein n=1 Tax=Larkinella soli TaxID=1770527 RepID=UPI000FFC411B|nr:OsmC family protein [Larkinella soli]